MFGDVAPEAPKVSFSFSCKMIFLGCVCVNGYICFVVTPVFVSAQISAPPPKMNIAFRSECSQFPADSASTVVLESTQLVNECSL